MAARKTGWGGARRGAGRPPKHGERGVNMTVWVAPDLKEWCEAEAAAREESVSDFVVGILERSRARRR